MTEKTEHENENRGRKRQTWLRVGSVSAHFPYDGEGSFIDKPLLHNRSVLPINIANVRTLKIQPFYCGCVLLEKPLLMSSRVYVQESLEMSFTIKMWNIPKAHEPWDAYTTASYAAKKMQFTESCRNLTRTDEQTRNRKIYSVLLMSCKVQN